MRPVRSIGIALVALLVLPLALAQQPGGSEASICPSGLEWMAGVGNVCPQPGGLYEVFNDEMLSVGFIHGTDPIPQDEEPVEVNGDSTPTCVSGAAGTYYAQVIYARAWNDVDNYDSTAGTIRFMVAAANSRVDDAAVATGSTADIRVKCVSGVVEVKNAILPTPYGSATFSNVVTDLRNLGYNDAKVKYWVYYDHQIDCGCTGTGHLYDDDRLDVSNYNNGNGASMFAITWGYESSNTWLHELAHNLGAVQNSAPHSTHGGHCYDGYDIMCYNDGGPYGWKYSTSYCSSKIFDCGKDDYFNVNPASGTYLASHWNLGSPLNRYLTIPKNIAPTMTSLACSPTSVKVGETVSCTFTATDPSDKIAFNVNWGDGVAKRVPSTGFIASGSTRSTTHAYQSHGSFKVSVTATDDSNYGPLTSAPLTISIVVEAPPPPPPEDVTPPTVKMTDPAPGSVSVGCGFTTHPFLLANAIGLHVYPINAGAYYCVKGTASDAESGLRDVRLYVDGKLAGTSRASEFVFAVKAKSTSPYVWLQLIATDNSGNNNYVTRSVVAVGP